MKVYTKIIITIVFVVSILAAAFAGSCIKEQEIRIGRTQRCHTLISFAINKAETNDLSNPDIMEALISNVYAAYELCDDPSVSAQLHDLWNDLIFDGDGYIGHEDKLATQLRIILEALAISK
jgi:hypothetical protein